MRRTMIGLTGAALALAGCGTQGTDGNAAAEAGMTAEAITTNDVTAIDAVTGDAANMAADVDYSNFAAGNEAGGGKSRPESARAGEKPRPARPAAADAAEPAEEPASEPPANATE